MNKEVEAEEDIDEAIASNPVFLLPRFNTLHSLVKQQVDYGDLAAAQQNYQRMLMLYDEINRSQLQQPEKQNAYGKLMDIFSKLSNPSGYNEPLNLLAIGKYLFPISLMVIVLLIIFFARPEFTMTGLAIFNGDSGTAPYWSADNAEFDIIGSTHINLDAYFKDADGDKLTYLVSGAPNIDVEVSGSQLVITPEPLIKGVRIISITASDGRNKARVSARLYIE